MGINKNIKKSKKYGFTLVEIIVTITIIVILGTIAFISLQGYSINARDGTRISDMRGISKGLILQHSQGKAYPIPDNFSTITASGLVIRYQGNAGYNVLNVTGVSGVNQGSGKDPKTGKYYYYVIDGDKTQYNLVGYFESGKNLLYNYTQQVSADYDDRVMKNIGGKLGVIYETDTSMPLHEKFPFGITVDVRNTENVYRIQFDTNDEVTGTGNILYSSYYNRDKYLLNNDSYAQLDNYLVGYWDMETTVLSGSIRVLKDISKNGNNGVCYNGSTIVTCMTYGVGPIIANGKMLFDGTNDYVQINKNVYSNTMTVLAKITPSVFDGTRHGVFGYQDSNNLRPFNLRMAPSQFAGNGGFHYDSHEISATSLSDACNTGKRCADNLNYQYNKDAEDIQFYVAYTRTPPFTSLNINGVPFINRDCREQPSPNFIDCTYPQVNTFNKFHTDFDYFWIGRVDNYFRGTIDDVRIYSRALTEPEIQALYESTNSKNSIKIN